MSGPPKGGWKRLIAASGYSWKGFVAAYRHEAAFRLEIGLGLFLAPAAFWLAEGGVELALLLGSLMLVLIVELLNSSLEAVVDRIGSEYHELSGRAKDFGSAAVFVALANVIVVWLILIVT